MEEQLKIDFDKVIKHLKPSKQEIELREKTVSYTHLRAHET